MTATQISDEVLEAYVQEGLAKLRRGDLWIAFHLHEDDVIMEGGNKEPDPSDKASNYYKFFDSVACDIATNFVLDKKDKKRIRQKLHTKWKRWQELIVPEDVATKPASPQKVKSVKKSPKLKKEEDPVATSSPPKKDDANNDNNLVKEETPISRAKRFNESLEEKKRQFEEARDLILAEVPHEVKDRFGKIYFTKWGKQILPCLAMNPYSVPPGSVRDMWLDMYDKVKANNRLQFMTILIYWYGSSNDPTNAYSFIESKKLIPYDAAIKKGLDKIPEATMKKYNEGKLTASNRLFVDGIMEMTEDLKKVPEERFGWMNSDFIEAYAITTDEEDDDDLTETRPIAKKKKAKTSTAVDEKKPQKLSNKKRKQASDGSKEDENDEELPGASKKPKKEKKKKSKNSNSALSEFFDPLKVSATGSTTAIKQEESGLKVKQETNDESTSSIPPATATATDSKTVKQADDHVKIHDVDEDYKFAMAESESEDNSEEDEDFNVSSSKVDSTVVAPFKEKKVRPKASKDLPKKKEKKVKHKIDKIVGKDKEIQSEEQRLKRAQMHFSISEKELNPIFVRWQQAIDAQDEDAIAVVIDDMSSRVEKVHFSLMPDINDFLKASKKILSDDRKDELKKIRSALKVQYDEKKKDIPPDFKPKRKFPKVDLHSSVETPTPSGPPVLVKSNGSSTSMVEEAPKAVLSAPIKRIGSLDKVVEKVEPKIEPENIPQKEVKVERKKFSLGNLMRPTSETRGLVKTEKSSSSTQLKQKQQQAIPDWVTGKFPLSKPDDENRAFALEFLQQAVPFIPNSQEVDHSAIAHALEAAIYDSVKKSEPSWIDRYWKKIDDIVVAISGDKGPGSISVMIAKGEFESPESVVQLSDAAIYDSFLGRPVFLSS